MPKLRNLLRINFSSLLEFNIELGLFLVKAIEDGHGLVDYALVSYLYLWVRADFEDHVDEVGSQLPVSHFYGVIPLNVGVAGDVE